MPDLPLTVFDLVVIGVIALSALFALVRGAVREAFTIAAWIGAFAVAWYGFAPAQAFAHQTIEQDWLADVAALVAAFVVPLIVFKVVGAVVAEQVQGHGLVGSLDRWLGVVFGLARGVAIVCLAYLGLTMVMQPDQHPAWVRDASLLPYVQEGAAFLGTLLPESATSGGVGRSAQRTGGGAGWQGAAW